MREVSRLARTLSWPAGLRLRPPALKLDIQPANSLPQGCSCTSHAPNTSTCEHASTYAVNAGTHLVGHIKHSVIDLAVDLPCCVDEGLCSNSGRDCGMCQTASGLPQFCRTCSGAVGAAAPWHPCLSYCAEAPAAPRVLQHAVLGVPLPLAELYDAALTYTTSSG